jgi:hypothetical protein
MHSACDSRHKLCDCGRILSNCHQTESQRRVELRDVSRIIGHDAPTIVPPPGRSRCRPSRHPGRNTNTLMRVATAISRLAQR